MYGNTIETDSGQYDDLESSNKLLGNECGPQWSLSIGSPKTVVRLIH